MAYNTILQNIEAIYSTCNSIIHRGATCVVFGNSNNKLFQIYDLQGEELVWDDIYLYDKNCVHFDYFIILNIAYLACFIDSIFSIILAKTHYEENVDSIIQHLIDNMHNYVRDKQNAVINWTKDIIDEYYKRKNKKFC